MKKKDTMTVRKEWVFELLDTLEMMKDKAETSGEDKVLHEMVKTFKNMLIIEKK